MPFEQSLRCRGGGKAARLSRPVGDDAVQSCPCPGAGDPGSHCRARRHRRADRSRASRVRDRPAVAPQSAALPQIEDRAGDRGGRRRQPGRCRRGAVPSALGGGAALFHRDRAAHGRPRRRLAAAGGGRGGGARARLHVDPARGARDQPRGDLPLPQERLPRVRPARRATTTTAGTRCGSRSGWRRSSPVSHRRRVISTRPPSSPAVRPAC